MCSFVEDMSVSTVAANHRKGLTTFETPLKIWTLPRPASLRHIILTIVCALLFVFLADTLPNSDVALSHLEIVNFIITCFMHTLRTPNSELQNGEVRVVWLCVCIRGCLWMCKWHISGSQPESQHHFVFAHLWGPRGIARHCLRVRIRPHISPVMPPFAIVVA